MGNQKLRGKDLRRLGIKGARVVTIALEVLRKHYRYSNKEEKLEVISRIMEAPEAFTEDPVLAPIAFAFLEKKIGQQEIPLNEKAAKYNVFGIENIDSQAIDQFEVALKLPVSIRGALMPDAHLGYGLPIGGVLATENAVIPYGVGVDIGCMMSLSVFGIDPEILNDKRSELKAILLENTRFGTEEFQNTIDHEVLARPEFEDIPFVKKLKYKAFRQIGSSGSGNHFVEFGIVDLLSTPIHFDLPPGKYLALLSHSGSRGLGAQISAYYTKLAMEKCLLPKQAKHLAWLDLDSEAGSEYWLAMNLAGDYASACHDQIHQKVEKALGEKAMISIKNHHNFAWKKKLENDKEVIVHRKGATPAGKGELGIIPGSMTAPGFIVCGKGHNDALDSASHGAGRLLSRRKAKQAITAKELRQYLKKQGVDLFGGGVDEAPMAYKDIHKVMGFQKELVDVIGMFYPKIVRMDSD